MRTKRLGDSQLEVPVIGLGCMVMPGFYGPGSEEQAIAGLDAGDPARRRAGSPLPRRPDGGRVQVGPDTKGP